MVNDGEGAVATARVRFGIDLSALLTEAEAGDLGTVVTAALGRLADEVGVGVAFAVLIAGDAIEEVWRWTTPSVQDPEPPESGQTLDEAFGAAVSILRADEPCPVPDLAEVDLTPEQRTRFEAMDARGLLLVPVVSRHQLVGVTGFLSVGSPRTWGHRETDMLRTFSKVLVTAALRSRSGAGSAAAAIRASRIAECIPDGLVTATTDGVITWASPTMMRLFGLSPEALVGQQAAALAPGFEGAVKEVVDQTLDSLATEELAVQLVGADGEPRWCELQVALAGDGPDDSTAELLFTIRDVHSRHVAFAQLEHAASHDSLTGAANRRGLRGAYQSTMATSRPIFMALADVDHFKAVNDRFGHIVGDQVLVELVTRLRDLSGERALVARLGGDEFVVVSDDVLSEEAVTQLCGRMVRQLHIPTAGGEHATVSVGAVFSTTPAELGDLLAHADEAIYRAKAAGRDRWSLRRLPRHA